MNVSVGELVAQAGIRAAVCEANRIAGGVSEPCAQGQEVVSTSRRRARDLIAAVSLYLWLSGNAETIGVCEFDRVLGQMCQAPPVVDDRPGLMDERLLAAIFVTEVVAVHVRRARGMRGEVELVCRSLLAVRCAA